MKKYTIINAQKDLKLIIQDLEAYEEFKDPGTLETIMSNIQYINYQLSIIRNESYHG